MEIKVYGYTYRGTAKDDHGVFTSSNGRVYAGKIAGGCARVGVVTLTNGTTEYAECGAAGQAHGRVLECIAGGDTEYGLWEHGSNKARARLRADGTCVYNRTACCADYAPFVALRAKVLPIKARPHQRPYAAFNPQSVHPSAVFWHSQELATTHADKVRTCRLRHQ